MRIQMEPTEYIIDMDGVKCRLWNGVTETGTPCVILVHRLAVDNPHDPEEFAQLLGQPEPKTMAVER